MPWIFLNINQNVVSKQKISANQIDQEINKINTKQYKKQILDEQGVLLTFTSKRDYLTYLDERDLELMERNS